MQVSFSDADLKGVEIPNQDALVLTLQVSNFEVKRVLIEPGQDPTSYSFFALFNMELTNKDVMKSLSVLVGFNGSSSQSVRRIPLAVFTPPYNLLVYFGMIASLMHC